MKRTINNNILNQFQQQIINRFDFSEILNGYLECILWTESDLENDTLENVLVDKTIFDFTKDSIKRSLDDITKFLNIAVVEAENELIYYVNDPSQLGVYFWLSRNGHGVGFFDNNHDKLQDIARNQFKTCNGIFLNNDNKVQIENY